MGRHTMPEEPTTCVKCGRADPDTEEVGMSLCSDCFHADHFAGSYWVPLWCTVLFVVALGFIIAALVQLGAQ